MRIALECPTASLGLVYSLADFDWILTHLVLGDPDYADFYRDSRHFKVLDNSTNELLKPCSLEDMKKAADIVNPDLICPPDFLGDGDSTVEAIGQAIEVFGFDKLLPIVQGSSERNLWECAEAIMSRGFNIIAVPYDLLCSREDSLDRMAMTRKSVVKGLLQDFSFQYIHLLGVTDPDELLAYKDEPRVCSVDTGAYYLNGQFSRLFGRDELVGKTKKLNFDATTVTMEVFWNLSYLRKVTNGRQGFSDQDKDSFFGVNRGASTRSPNSDT